MEIKELLSRMIIELNRSQGGYRSKKEQEHVKQLTEEAIKHLTA